MSIILLLATIFLAVYFLVFLTSRKDHSQIAIYRIIIFSLIASIVWTITNLIFLVFPADRLYYVALISYWGGLFSLLSVFLFALYFDKKEISKKLSIFTYALVITGVVISSITSIPGFVLQEIVLLPNGNFQYVVTPHLSIYGGYIFTIMIASTAIMIIKYLKMSRNDKKRSRFILLSNVFAVIWGLTFNMILPIYGNYSLAWLGPISVILWVGTVIYTIVRYRLFSIGLVVGKTIQFSLTVLFTILNILLNSIPFFT